MRARCAARASISCCRRAECASVSSTSRPTSPLEPVNGFVVSGDEGIGDGFAFPPEVRDVLAAEGYRVPFGASYAPGREREFADHALEVLAMRRRAAVTCSATAAGSLACSPCISTASCCTPSGRSTTRPTPATGPRWTFLRGRDPLLDALKGIDDLLGQIVTFAGPRGLVIFMGAWGHRMVHSKVHLNAVLERSGDLRFRRDLRTHVKRLTVRLGVSRHRRALGASAQPVPALPCQAGPRPAGQGHGSDVLVLSRHRLAADARGRDGV